MKVRIAASVASGRCQSRSETWGKTWGTLERNPAACTASPAGPRRDAELLQARGEINRSGADVTAGLEASLPDCAAPTTSGGALGSRGLCLVIEDDQDIRDLVALILARIGFDVLAVRNGVEGGAAAWEHDPVLITADLNLPDLDGLDVARHIRARSDAPMLFITARADADDEMVRMASGATTYLTKPFRTWQLTDAVNALCPTDSLTVQGHGAARFIEGTTGTLSAASSRRALEGGSGWLRRV